MEETFNLEILEKASKLGFVGVFIDEKYGGGGFGFVENTIIMEEFWRGAPAWADSLGVHGSEAKRCSLRDGRNRRGNTSLLYVREKRSVRLR
jgi:alkylation response protein AidB-like acyl-CoA dehydrogenase